MLGARIAAVDGAFDPFAVGEGFQGLGPLEAILAQKQLPGRAGGIEFENQPELLVFDPELVFRLGNQAKAVAGATVGRQPQDQSFLLLLDGHDRLSVGLAVTSDMVCGREAVPNRGIDREKRLRKHSEIWLRIGLSRLCGEDGLQ